MAQTHRTPRPDPPLADGHASAGNYLVLPLVSAGPTSMPAALARVVAALVR